VLAHARQFSGLSLGGDNLYAKFGS